MGIPCKECIVYAMCRARYSGVVNATIECEYLWNYIVEETHADLRADLWLKSAERQERMKRMDALKRFFPNYKELSWGGDKL